MTAKKEWIMMIWTLTSWASDKAVSNERVAIASSSMQHQVKASNRMVQLCGEKLLLIAFLPQLATRKTELQKIGLTL